MALICHSNSRFVDGISKISEGVGSLSLAAGDLVGAGANATVAFKTFGVDSLTTAATAASEVMRGVDLVNISIMRSAWVIGAFNLHDLREWLAQKQDIPWPARQWFLAQASATSLSLPAFAGVHELMLVNGSYMQLSLHGRARRDQVVAISLVVVTVSFDVYWTNC